MKVKTSVALSDTLLADIDRHTGKGANRSEFIETAVRSYIAALVRRRQNLRDRKIIDRRAARLNREAEDVLDYQVPF